MLINTMFLPEDVPIIGQEHLHLENNTLIQKKEAIIPDDITLDGFPKALWVV